MEGDSADDEAAVRVADEVAEAEDWAAEVPQEATVTAEDEATVTARDSSGSEA